MGPDEGGKDALRGWRAVGLACGRGTIRTKRRPFHAFSPRRAQTARHLGLRAALGSGMVVGPRSFARGAPSAPGAH